ncbi:MAG: hypothetical protein ACLGH3_03900 [Actinomycetota bacterium]
MKRIITLAAIAALTMPVSGAQAEVDPTCGRQGGPDGRPVEAQITSPSGGQLVIYHPAGQVSFTAQGATDQGIVASGTGFIDVTVQHSCLMLLHLTVTDDAGNIIHDNTTEVSCDDDLEHTESVEIGLDAGEFTFSLNGSVGCDDSKVRDAGNGHYVADPPIPAPDIRRSIA